MCSVEVEPAPSLRVHSEGEGCGPLRRRITPRGPGGHGRARPRPRRRHGAFADPGGAGLGSSAALAAAAAAAAGAEDPFAVAAAYDGHPRTRRPASSVDSSPPPRWMAGRCTRHLPLHDGLAFVAIVPDRNLATPEARPSLPETLTRADAVFNLGRMGLLLAGLADPALPDPRGHRRPDPPAGAHDPLPRGARAPRGPSGRGVRPPPAGLAPVPTLIGVARAGSAAAVRRPEPRPPWPRPGCPASVLALERGPARPGLRRRGRGDAVGLGGGQRRARRCTFVTARLQPG